MQYEKINIQLQLSEKKISKLSCFSKGAILQYFSITSTGTSCPKAFCQYRDSFLRKSEPALHLEGKPQAPATC